MEQRGQGVQQKAASGRGDLLRDVRVGMHDLETQASPEERVGQR